MMLWYVFLSGNVWVSVYFDLTTFLTIFFLVTLLSPPLSSPGKRNSVLEAFPSSVCVCVCLPNLPWESIMCLVREYSESQTMSSESKPSESLSLCESFQVVRRQTQRKWSEEIVQPCLVRVQVKGDFFQDLSHEK